MIRSTIVQSLQVKCFAILSCCLNIKSCKYISFLLLTLTSTNSGQQLREFPNPHSNKNSTAEASPYYEGFRGRSRWVFRLLSFLNSRISNAAEIKQGWEWRSTNNGYQSIKQRGYLRNGSSNISLNTVANKRFIDISWEIIYSTLKHIAWLVMCNSANIFQIKALVDLNLSSLLESPNS